MVINRGEIWWASLPEPQGSEPGYRRPILIIQANSFNQSKISTVIGIVVTSNLKLSNAPGNVLLKAKDSGLPRDSVLNISQVITVDKKFIKQKVKRLSNKTLQQVEEGLRLILEL